MFGQVPEEQVEWTKEHIALKVDQFILWNKQMKLSLLNDKHILYTIDTFVGIPDLGDLQYFVLFHDYYLPYTCTSKRCLESQDLLVESLQ